jgi:YHS domain-containing protein
MTAKARQISILATCAGGFLAVLLADVHAATLQPSQFSQLLNLPLAGERQLTHDSSGIGLHGFDPVSYRLGSIPLGGKSEYEAVIAGVAWRFASEANREAFLSDPASYIPTFDGYDATAISSGRAVEGDPLIFTHINAQIYFFRSFEARERFLDAPALRQQAEAQWPMVMAQLAR